jgi:hypothetical protein
MSLAQKGALVPLDDVSHLFRLPEGLDTSSGRQSVAQKEGQGPEHLYGIPLDWCAGLSPVVDPKGMMLAFPVQPGEALSSSIDAANVLLKVTRYPPYKQPSHYLPSPSRGRGFFMLKGAKLGRD